MHLFRLVSGVLSFAVLLDAQGLRPNQKAMLGSIDAATNDAILFLGKLVNINSGTNNSSGVQAVAVVMDGEFRALGFDTRLLPGTGWQRGPHLLAEHKGTRPARPLLLIGHMDTVFEPVSQFQRFERTNESSASGPGVIDMKGGLAIMLYALKALNRAGMLEDANIRIFLTGDEEAPGKPVAAARRDLIEAAKAPLRHCALKQAITRKDATMSPPRAEEPSSGSFA